MRAIKYEKSTRKIYHDGKHIGTQRKSDYKVVPVDEAFA